MLKVLPQILVVGVVVRPVPSLPHFRPGQFVLGNRRVDTRSGLAVPSPSSSETVSGLEDHGLVPTVSESLQHEDAGYRWMTKLG